ncbi:hypothetical protein [Luteimonas huabeiensis]|uniref:hypothetical protein n=1 Tax=Luteimonas huabeiensis TaxID=1244513 RepID=UPI000465187C|nr:hypothetical protein [Luteimonas huabeiensis]
MQTADALRFALSDRIQDAEVGPKHVPLALLGQFQEDVEEFLRGSNREIDSNQVMVSIEEGSLAIVVTGLLAASGLWRDMAQLENPAALGLLDPKRAEVLERWQKAARKNPHRSYQLADTGGRFAVRVDSESDFRNQVEAAWVPVEKYLRGVVVDLGGKTSPNVHLDLGSGRAVKIAATQKLLAEEKENRLYKQALLHVSAEENLKTGALRNLNLLGFEEHRPTWDEAEFDKLVRAGTQAWADTPEGWLENLRSGKG